MINFYFIVFCFYAVNSYLVARYIQFSTTLDFVFI